MSQANHVNTQISTKNLTSGNTTDASIVNENPISSTKLSKVLCVEIKGTLGGFSAMGPTAATWRPIEGRQASMFGSDDAMTGSGSNTGQSNFIENDYTTATNSLKNVTITKATILQSYNTFGMPLGVSVNCLPSCEVCDTGDKYTFTTIPNTSVSHPSVLYEAGECQSQAVEWRKTYSKWNSTNLETQDVLKVPDCPYVFVHEAHPVINLLRINRHLLGVDIDNTPKMDGQWYKITEPLMQTSCEALRTKVLSKIATQDLTQLQVQLHRIGGVEWSHIDDADTLMTFAPNPDWDEETLRTNLHAHERNFTEKPSTFMARIRIEYEMQKA